MWASPLASFIMKKQEKAMCFFIIACSYFESIHATTEIYVFDDYSIINAAIEWCDDESTARTDYGDISTWDVSRVTDMGNLFANCVSTNILIDSWNTSNVVTMTYMFYNAQFFNRNIGGK